MVDPAEIDRIVREVLRRLQHAAPQPNGAPVSSAGEITIALPVLSVSALEGKLDGVQRVKVRQGTVVTPAARDLLRQKRATLEIVSGRSGGSAATSKADLRLVIGVAGSAFDGSAIVRSAGELAQVEQLARTGLTTVVGELAEHIVRGGSLGLLITSEVMAALCLANRYRGVRAARADGPACVRDAATAVGANLLVVPARGKSVYQVQRIVQAYCAAGPRECPETLRAMLGA